MEIRGARLTGLLKMITLKFLAVAPEWMVMLPADIGNNGRRNHLRGSSQLHIRPTLESSYVSRVYTSNR